MMQPALRHPHSRQRFNRAQSWTFELIFLSALITGALFLRIVGLNWDEFQHLHPDERFLTMVTSAISSPAGWSGYFNTETSPLNPYNSDYKFFVYGTAPIFAVRYIGELLAGTSLALGSLPVWMHLPPTLALGTGYDEVHLLGRIVSACADLLLVLAVYALGTELYSRNAGRLAALLAAGTPALIQQAHFFTVDSFATLFVALTLLFAARVRTRRGYSNYIMFGVCMGVALASRINTAPLAIFLAIGAFANLEPVAHGSWWNAEVRALLLRVLAAAVATLLVFRVLQPYAFAGPGFFGVSPNPHWLQTLGEIRGQMTGDVDFPPNHQWTNRPALLFPLQNMVLWGMGPALGVAVWLATLWCAWRIYQHNEWRTHLLPVAWTLLYFAWQGTQWVKPIRYFLPIYPTLLVMGGWGLTELVQRASRVQRLRNWALLLGLLTSATVVVFTLGSGWAFTRIYTRPVTRVAATSWIYQNLPGGITLRIGDPGAETSQPIPLPENYVYDDGAARTITFTAQETGALGAIWVAHLGDPQRDPDAETLTLELMADGETDAISRAQLTSDFSASGGDLGAFAELRFDPLITLKKGERYQLRSVADGFPVSLAGTQIANESSWDDGLPLRMDGYDGFGGIYGGHNLEMYWDDNAEKRERFITELSASDYIVISSNRQSDSITRLPMRYPLTIAYYKALFSGELGFELAKEFESAPNLGPWIFSDAQAEEPFTVYDHPKVMIFRKAENFSAAKVATILGSVDLSQVVWMNPKKATSAPTALMLPTERAAIQRAGGTWSSMFNITGLLNTQPWLAAGVWWLLLMLLGWSVFPLSFLGMSGLPDKGFAITKTLVALLVAWLAWLLASFQIAVFSAATLWMVWGLWAAISASMARWHWQAISAWLRQHWRYLIGVEFLWLLLFGIFTVVRWGNADLWHPSYGGEKPMDFSYFNAVVRSTYFPAYDPWLAGGYLNYYYFGFVIAASLTKMFGVMPALAYNLILPTLFAGTGAGAFCVAYNLVESSRPAASAASSAWRAGLAALALMVLLGNLAQPAVWAKGVQRIATDVVPMDTSILGDWQRVATGAYRNIVSGANLPVGTGEWYWNATRVIPHPDSEAGPITEFPLFTFLYADLHAHMMALPLTLLALAWALGAALAGSTDPQLSSAWLFWLIGGVTLGSLRATNTWDFPAYLTFGMIAVWLGHMHSVLRPTLQTGFVGAARALLLAGLALLFFRPFFQWYASSYGAAEIWTGSATTLGAYLKVHGLFLFVIVAWLLAETRDWMQHTPRAEFFGSAAALSLAAGAATLAIVLAALLVLGIQVALVALPLAGWCLALGLRAELSMAKRVAFGVVIAALVLTLVVELVVLEGDISRMNTVFKFYLQVWTMLSVTAGAALAWLWPQRSAWRPVNRFVLHTGLGVMVVAAAFYTASATLAKVTDRMAPNSPRTLDGMRFLNDAAYEDRDQRIILRDDYLAMRWLLQNVSGSPVIVEAHTSEYKLGSRFTMYTGLPGVVGWNWHQRQQRGLVPPNLVTDRVDAIEEFFQSPLEQTALDFIKRYGVRYVIVGDYERAYYESTGLQKFERMLGTGHLKIAYRNNTTTVYEAQVRKAG